jgi:NTE family protein
LAVLCLLATFNSGLVRAEEGSRPKIGLALGGGGAKGGAHVGVIKVLEELNVPIDYIAGTSIGAIIGGLYASGMTSDELAEALASIDWAEAMQDRPPRRDLNFRRKEDSARYLFDLEVGIGRGGLEWPAGFISGQNLFFLLQSLTIPVADVDDFDELSIPFRAVATDVGNGEMVVLDHGYLATAMRASMAIPGFFSPVELEDRLLVDGGMVNNLPVDVAFEMGADIVIAVDLGEALSAREVGRSVVQIYQQTIRMLTRPNVDSRLEISDLVINPGVSGYATMAFDKIVEIMEKGEETTRGMVDEIARYSVAPEVYQAHRQAQIPPPPEPVRIDFVDFVGNERVDDRVIRKHIRLEAGSELTLKMFGDDLSELLGGGSRREERRVKQLTGETPIDLRALFEDLRRIYGLGEFEQVDFGFEERGEERGVVIRMREKPWGPNYLHFGLEIATEGSGDTLLQFLVNLTKTTINARGAEWRSDLLVGNNRGAFTEFYQPLDFGGRFFIAPRVDYDAGRIRLFEEGQSRAELDISDTTFGFDFGYQAGTYAEVRLGALSGFGRASVETGTIPPDLEEELRDIGVGGARLLVRADRLDSVTIPRKGWSSHFRAFQSLEGVGADSEYTKLEWSGEKFFSRGKHTGFGGGGAGWSTGDLPIYDEFTLGGFGSMSGYADNELRGQYLGLGRMGYYYRILKSWYVGGWAEAGNTWQVGEPIQFSTLRYSGTVILAKDTLIGPLYVAYAQADAGRNKFYFILGRTPRNRSRLD